ncbi:leucine-rich repeat domain-containing protein [Xanthomarina sp. F1114]|uniref:leucine-rich repeat domain-containing protein n=1 Tax=Xanthomarina sp. F1114 TaxID=2996019 RepID=UPI00225E3F1A|nr:leucine-rich repeat domain-containing protein [Xanthomarina sp. F1114]MCX7548771.1 leucine-rich repeat domain-containing protein [Xanthomarina sp. F1114]
MKQYLLLFLFSINFIQSQTFNDGTLEYTVTDVTNNYVSVTSYNNICPTGSLVIPETVTDNSIVYTVIEIAEFAFNACPNLTNVSLPDSISIINTAAFRNSSGLTSINMPANLISIENQGFSGCSSLTNVTFPVGLTSLKRRAFEDCTSLTNVNLPNSVNFVGFEAFKGCTSLTDVSLSNSMTNINTAVFYGCSSLINVSIPDSITSISSFVFYGCTSLISVNLPANLDVIWDRAFFGCTSLTTINFPNTLTSIGEQSFFNTNLNEIHIPESVTTIDEGAFQLCDNLTNVTVNWNTPLAIDATVFASVPINTIPLTVPVGTIPDYQAAAVWQDFGSFILTITDFEVAKTIRLHPNPTSNFLIIKLDHVSDLKTTLIYNSLGQLVSEEKTTKIDVSNYSKGIYIAQIETTNGKISKKFIVK